MFLCLLPDFNCLDSRLKYFQESGFSMSYTNPRAHTAGLLHAQRRGEAGGTSGHPDWISALTQPQSSRESLRRLRLLVLSPGPTRQHCSASSISTATYRHPFVCTGTNPCKVSWPWGDLDHLLHICPSYSRLEKMACGACWVTPWPSRMSTGVESWAYVTVPALGSIC